MKAITIWQPWASLIALGHKPFETRLWPPRSTLLGQRVAIHAAARRVPRAELYFEEAEAALRLDSTMWNEGLPFGAVVATARLAGAYQVANELGELVQFWLGPSEFPIHTLRDGSDVDALPKGWRADGLGDYSPGRWLWHFDRIAPLDPPIEAKGAQGWWTWDAPAGVAA